MISLIIPVYKNSDNIRPLLEAVEALNDALAEELEVVFVVDGSPDDSALQLTQALPSARFRSQCLLLSRNYGAFEAIRAGLAAGSGDFFAVMAADLQEPPSLIEEFYRQLRAGGLDVVVGQRVSRDDPWLSKLSSTVFWGLYRRFIQRELPPGGVDIFGCTRQVRDQLVALRENNTSLVGLLFWVGFRRSSVPYARRGREAGVSAWTLQKKIRYLADSVFSFSDLPIRVLLRLGVVGLGLATLFAAVVVVARVTGAIPVPGYAATALLITFFGALNCFGLGVIGGYVWRTYENTKGRPGHIVRWQETYLPAQPAVGEGDGQEELFSASQRVGRE